MKFLFYYGLIFAIVSCNILFAEELTLRMLVWEPYLSGELPRQSFKKMVKEKFNVDLKLDIQYVSSDDEYFPALRDDKTDVIVLSHSTPKDERYQLMRLKLALPLNLKTIPDYKYVFSDLREADYCRHNGNVYCVPTARGPYGLIYNTKEFNKPPTSWNILWDPKYKGKYILGRDQYEQNVYLTALAMGYSKEKMYDYKTLNTPKFQEKLIQLARNAHSMWVGVEKPDDLTGMFLACGWGVAIPQMRERGEIWEMVRTREGTTAWMDNFMLSALLEKRPRLRKIAELWLNYTLTNEYQKYIVRHMGAEPVTTRVKEVLTPKEIEFLNLDDPDFASRYILWPTLDKRDRKGLKRLWDKAIGLRHNPSTR